MSKLKELRPRARNLIIAAVGGVALVCSACFCLAVITPSGNDANTTDETVAEIDAESFNNSERDNSIDEEVASLGEDSEPTEEPEPTDASEPTVTPRPTNTPEPTDTTEPTATASPRSTNTPRPTATATPRSTNTPRPTSIPQPTSTPVPTNPPVPTNTIAPTQPPLPTATTAPPTEPPPAPSDVVIINVNKRDEYVDIRNNGGQPQDLSGWLLRSERGNQDCPLGGVVEAQTTLRIWALAEDAGQGGFNCGFGGPIWNNSEYDPAVLFNSEGIEVSRYP